MTRIPRTNATTTAPSTGNLPDDEEGAALADGESTDLAPRPEDAMTVLQGNLMAATPQSGGGRLLPQLKVPYAIEVGGDSGIRLSDCFHLGIFDGTKFDKFSKPYTLAGIASRNAVRRPMVTINGVKVPADSKDPAHKDLKKTYDRAVAPIKEGQKPSDEYTRLIREGGQRGASFIVAVLTDDGKVCITQFDTYSVALTYWGKPLAATCVKTKQGMRVTTISHEDNLTKGDSGNQYLDPKKFKGWTPVQLTDDQIKAVASALADGDTFAKFMHWMGQE